MLFITSIALGLASAVSAQQPADPYITGLTLLSPKGCPVFVGKVVPGSPADRAGILPGDRLVAVAGTHVGGLGEAARLLRSVGPTTIVLTLSRRGKEIELASEVERRSSIFGRNGHKVSSGVIVSADTVQEEVERMLAFDSRRYVARVFPTHYPTRPDLFYAGFEIFVLRDPTQTTVGGIEEGPASKAGVHWGDVLLSVNDVPVAGKLPFELEQMFSAARPAIMRLQIDRLGAVKNFEIKLENARDIARQNGLRFVDGQIVPIWATDMDLHCFLK